jgi:hypothetical protein
MTRIEVSNSPRRRSSGRAGRILLGLVLVILVGLGLWTWLTLAWAYSDGERAGVLQKFSRRGWLCKTSEGELAQYVVAGVSPQIWTFSVRDPAVAAALDKAVGERVQLHYTEHPGVPTACFADTRYFVDKVTVRGEGPRPEMQSAPGASPGATPGAPGPAPADSAAAAGGSPPKP